MDIAWHQIITAQDYPQILLSILLSAFVGSLLWLFSRSKWVGVVTFVSLITLSAGALINRFHEQASITERSIAVYHAAEHQAKGFNIPLRTRYQMFGELYKNLTSLDKNGLSPSYGALRPLANDHRSTISPEELLAFQGLIRECFDKDTAEAIWSEQLRGYPVYESEMIDAVVFALLNENPAQPICKAKLYSHAIPHLHQKKAIQSN